MNNRWLQVTAIAFTIVFTASILAVGLGVYCLAYQPMIPKQFKPVVFQVNNNDTAYAFVKKLKQCHFIKSERLLLWYIRFKALSPSLKAGVYVIVPGESAKQFLSRVIAGDVLNEQFRIVEGTTQKQVSDNLEKAPWLTYQSTDWYSIVQGYSSAEGLLLADTYQYDAGSSAKKLLKQAHDSLEQYLATAWQHRSPGLPYQSPYELLIAASIIVKETALPNEQRLISGVIANRLRKRMPLQMDPTVIYALGSHYHGKLTHEDMKFQSPYNTYRQRGLPPTPIAMVGKEAILAAAKPESTDYLYFVAKGDGTHQFSKTYEQQRKAINQYLKKTTNSHLPTQS